MHGVTSGMGEPSPVVPTEADERAGRDPVLAYAVEQILRKSAA